MKGIIIVREDLIVAGSCVVTDAPGVTFKSLWCCPISLAWPQARGRGWTCTRVCARSQRYSWNPPCSRRAFVFSLIRSYEPRRTSSSSCLPTPYFFYWHTAPRFHTNCRCLWRTCGLPCSFFFLFFFWSQWSLNNWRLCGVKLKVCAVIWWP